MHSRRKVKEAEVPIEMVVILTVLLAVNTAQGAVTANTPSTETPVKQLVAMSPTPGHQTSTTGMTSFDSPVNAAVCELRASEIAVCDPYDVFIDAVCGHSVWMNQLRN